jgi:hypothetical protein
VPQLPCVGRKGKPVSPIQAAWRIATPNAENVLNPAAQLTNPRTIMKTATRPRYMPLPLVDLPALLTRGKHRSPTFWRRNGPALVVNVRFSDVARIRVRAPIKPYANDREGDPYLCLQPPTSGVDLLMYQRRVPAGRVLTPSVLR